MSVIQFGTPRRSTFYYTALFLLTFILLFSFNIGNVAYCWAALMVFSTIKYFKSTC